jgi:ribosomal-protein-alanine N-acetyltransferase
VQSAEITLRPVNLETDGPTIFQAWGHEPANFAYLTVSGIIGIVKINVMGHRSVIGYVIHRPYWGNGFATTAVRQATALIEEIPEVARIWATCALENPASARVLEKCGFEHEGILRNWVTYPAQGGSAFDNHSYVKIPARWR